MRLILHLGAALSFLSGFVVLIVAKSPVQEISAFVLFVGSAVFIVGVCVVEAISITRKSIELKLDVLRLTADPSPPPPSLPPSTLPPSTLASLPVWKRRSE